MPTKLRSILVLLAVAACAVTLAPAGGEWDKPWQVVGSATQVLDFAAGAGRCDLGHPAVIIQGGGRASYLGVVNIDQSHCLNLASGQFYDGQFTVTAADGSAISGTYGGQSVPTVNCPNIAAGQCVFRILGGWEITGGTGRAATVLNGSGAARGTVNTITGMASVFLQGNVVSDGALKGEF